MKSLHKLICYIEVAKIQKVQLYQPLLYKEKRQIPDGKQLFCVYSHLYIVQTNKNDQIMENINLQLLRKINCLLTGLLAIIGFSCGENGEIPCEYGSPHANFQIKGK